MTHFNVCIPEMPDCLHVIPLRSKDAWLTAVSYACRRCLTAYRWLICMTEMPGWQLTHMHPRDAWLTGDSNASQWCLTAYMWLICFPKMPDWQLSHMHAVDAWQLTDDSYAYYRYLTADSWLICTPGWQVIQKFPRNTSQLKGDKDAAHRHPRDGLQIAVAVW
jgi:hypothetical protein